MQISEVVNSMRDLIQYSINNGIGPMGELIMAAANFTTKFGLMWKPKYVYRNKIFH